MRSVVFALVLSVGQMLAQNAPAIGQGNSHFNLPARKIQPNDLIGVEVYGSPELTRTARVGSDGAISLPLVKQRIKVQGLMPSDAENAIASALTKEGIIVDPVVTVTVAEYHQNQPISVAGAVRTPLTFQTDEKVTLLDAISRAGGLTPQAGPEILISHGPKDENDGTTVLVRRVRTKDLIEKADPEANIVLSGGEEIRVPETGNVFVLGNVKAPGAFPVRDGSESTTVLRIVALAGGLLPNARSQAYIYRREAGAGSKNEVPIQLKEIVDGKAPDVTLMADDVLYIPDNRARRDTLAVLQNVLMFGSGVAAYAIIAHH